MERRFRILLIDDDTLAAFIQKKTLTAHGYEVSVSNTAVNIFDVVKRYDPDLIIMDHNIPIVSGMEATRQLKANPQTAAIPIIYYSSALDIDHLAKLAGSDAYMSKADARQHMAELIAALLAGK